MCVVRRWEGNQAGSCLCVYDVDRQADKSPESERGCKVPVRGGGFRALALGGIIAEEDRGGEWKERKGNQGERQWESGRKRQGSGVGPGRASDTNSWILQSDTHLLQQKQHIQKEKRQEGLAGIAA